MTDPFATKERAESLLLRWGDSDAPACQVARDCLALVERLGRAEATIEAALRECERLNDVRANRTRVIGNVHLILQGAALASPDERKPDE